MLKLEKYGKIIKVVFAICKYRYWGVCIMINFIVCDDNEVIRKQVEDLIIKVMMKNNLSYKVHL